MGKKNKINAEKPEVKRSDKGALVQKKERVKTKAVSAVDNILHLQRTIGNQAVQRLFRSGTLQAKLKIGQPNDKYEVEADRIADQVMSMPEISNCLECKENGEEPVQTKPITTQITPLVRRQVEPEEEEEPIQPKLLSVEDPLLQRQEEEEEEEEESIQPKLLSAENPVLQRQTEPEEEKEEESIQRQEEKEEEEESIQTKSNSSSAAVATTGIESSINSLKGGGQPLPEAVRNYFETRFGYNFSQVRVHNNVKASETAKAINARAFTSGKDVVFGANQYSPQTDSGKSLLAHELTHVVQQSDDKVQRQPEEEGVTYKAARTKFKIKLSNDYVNKIQMGSIFRMTGVFQTEFERLFLEIDKEENFKKEAIEFNLAPLTAIPFVGSWAATWVGYWENSFNKKGWGTVEECVLSFKESMPTIKLARGTEEAKHDFDKFLSDDELNRFFEEQYAKFDWKDKSLDDFVLHLSKENRLLEIYDKYINKYDNEFWKNKFYETIGAEIKIRIYRHLLAQRSSASIGMGIILPGVTVSGTNPEPVIKELHSHGYGTEYQQWAFKQIYYQNLKEAVPLVKNRPLEAPAKWHDFLTYCRRNGGLLQSWSRDDPEIWEIRDAAMYFHMTAVKAYLNHYWQELVKREKIWVVSEEEKEKQAEQLLIWWGAFIDHLSDFVRKDEQVYNAYDLYSKTVNIFLKFYKKVIYYRKIVSKKRSTPY